MPRLANTRGVKKHWNYDVAEAADVTGVCRNTVREWIKNGLQIVSGRKPFLILGADLKSFLDDRNSRRKRPLKPGEIYCLPCHGAKRPALGMVEFVLTTASMGTLSGICPDCERMINRHASRSSLDNALGDLTLSVAADGGTLRNPAPFPVNSDFRNGNDDD